jgi:hypothetical protein
MEYAKFLQDTVKEMAREVTRSGKMKQRAEDIDQFIKKVLDLFIISVDLFMFTALLFCMTLDHSYLCEHSMVR